MTSAGSLVRLYTRETDIPAYVRVYLKHGSVISSLCVFTYDYLCTFDQEIEYVWSRRRSLGSYLFLLNRYLPFMDLTLSLYAIKVRLSPEQCLRHYSLITWCNMAGIFICHVILGLRTIAIWEKNAWVLFAVSTILSATLITSIVTSKKYMDSLIFVPSDPNFFFGCTLHKGSTTIIYSFIAVFVAETAIVILTLIRTITHLRRSNSSWVRQVYQRGFILYLYTLGLTTLNLLFPIFAPPAIKTTFTDPQRAFHSIFATRVLFNILGVQKEQEKRERTRIRSSSRRMQGEAESDIILSTVLDTFVTRDHDSG
ncbi:hypothetical protein CPC08DRAFT_713068 [Agrocybe pediades]|nr:hypothetical protein CPC08DRAFT_713068 [Agrocybe pediades]